MGRYREKTSTLFTRLAYGLRGKQRQAIAQLLRSPAPQTSLVLELPDELILSIISHIAPDTQYTSHWVRFRLLHDLGINGDHMGRVLLLQRLGMTCRAMRLRLVPWIWERLELRSSFGWGSVEGPAARKLGAIADALRVDTSLATNVKFMTMDITWNRSSLSSFLKCLQSLPNLHTLEIGRVNNFPTTELKYALMGVELPQIKSLILPPAAHFLLRHCRHVEDVVCVTGDLDMSPGGFLISLSSKRDSKVKRLAISLVTWDNPSRFVAACPMLTELTVIFPHLYWNEHRKTGFLLDQVNRARSAVLDLVGACKALPNFATLQIAHFPIISPPLVCTCMWRECDCDWYPMEGELERHMKGLEEWTIDCLKPKTGCQEGEGRGRTAFRVIKFSSDRPRHSSVKVEEYEV